MDAAAGHKSAQEGGSPSFFPPSGERISVQLIENGCNGAGVMSAVAHIAGSPLCQVVVVNHCFTSLFGTNGLLSKIVIRQKRCSQLMRSMMYR